MPKAGLGLPRHKLVSPNKSFALGLMRASVQDMWDTMDAEGGIGIAAPQIGVSQQIVCFGTYESECAKGALHVPRTVLGLRGVVTRPIAVRYRGLDLEGNEIDRTVDGLHARVVQHECDQARVRSPQRHPVSDARDGLD